MLHRHVQSFMNMSVCAVALSTERKGRNQLSFRCVTRSPAERQRWKGAPLAHAPAYNDSKTCSAAAAPSGWADINGQECAFKWIAWLPSITMFHWQSGCTRLDASLLEQNGMMWLGIKLGMKPLKPVQCCERSTHDPDLHLCRDHGKEQVLNR